MKTKEQRLGELEDKVLSEDSLQFDDIDGAPDLDSGSSRAEAEAEKIIAGLRYGDVRRDLPRALPFLPEPGFRAFAANVPGDAGFDPLGLCSDIATFVDFREAELKHGRLAMLAAVAWPVAEVVDEFDVDAGESGFLADSGGQVLPQLTDGLGPGGPGNQFVESFIALVLLTGAIFELGVAKKKGALPGDLDFDPLNVRDFSPGVLESFMPPQRRWMFEAELKHGRLAMGAFVYFVVDEVLTGNPVIEDTGFWFHKIDVKFLSPQYWTFQPEAIDAAAEFPADFIPSDVLVS